MAEVVFDELSGSMGPSKKDGRDAARSSGPLSVWQVLAGECDDDDNDEDGIINPEDVYEGFDLIDIRQRLENLMHDAAGDALPAGYDEEQLRLDIDYNERDEEDLGPEICAFEEDFVDDWVAEQADQEEAGADIPIGTTSRGLISDTGGYTQEKIPQTAADQFAPVIQDYFDGDNLNDPSPPVPPKGKNRKEKRSFRKYTTEPDIDWKPGHFLVRRVVDMVPNDHPDGYQADNSSPADSSPADSSPADSSPAFRIYPLAFTHPIRASLELKEFGRDLFE
ncbi:hypothetical protein B0T20DRAFT_465601 [Sordaria brevicollis]|uniref:Uncharacterized protein n=1 Tax=Sordaria brevicollis TaxID=83679 RepID=A0AAE0PMP7_SORBR|nr:hypothetical protein B0T20DRAFT_465601 [Sordaria brevicollis]